MTTAMRLLAVGLLAASAAGRAENLVANSEFDDGVAGWERFGPGTEPEFESTIDHNECAASGSAVFQTNTIDDANWMRTCVLGIVPGATYSLGGEVRFVVAAGFETAKFYVEWRGSEEDCTGADRGSAWTEDHSGGPNEASWTAIANASVVAPADAHSAWVSFLLNNPVAGFTQARVDGVYLRTGADFSFGDGFEAGTLCRWSFSQP